MYAFEDQQTQTQATTTHSIAHLVPSQTVVQTFSNPDGTVSLIQVSKPYGYQIVASGADQGAPHHRVEKVSFLQFPVLILYSPPRSSC